MNPSNIDIRTTDEIITHPGFDASDPVSLALQELDAVRREKLLNGAPVIFTTEL